MRIKSLAIILIFVGLFINTTDSYGCGNESPVACSGVDPANPIAGLSVTFNATGSYDPDGSGGINGIYKFEWDWENDGTYDHIETYPCDGIAAHTFTLAGQKTVKIRVTDGEGARDTTTRTFDVGNVIYVDVSSYPFHDGTTWERAFVDLQDALDAAEDAAEDAGVNDNEIWVANGTYYPDEGTGRTDDDRTEAFELVADIGVYGGFEGGSRAGGGETERSQRDWANNETILSGDIDDVGNNDSYNVVVGAAGATVDGFTITKGYADHASTFQYQCGGGMWNENVSPTVRNCIFTDNEAYFGGGMFNDTASPTIKNCIFADNTARMVDVGVAGAIFCYDYSDAVIENCTITQNTADYAGGGIVAESFSEPQISNSIILYNQDSFGYSDIDAYGSSAITVNYSDYGILYADGATITHQNCISVDPQFADAGNDDFHIKSAGGRWNGSSWVADSVTSPCINAGDPASGCSLEPENNGDRINMGFYGNTAEASKSDLYPFSYSLETNDIYSLPTEAAWGISGGSVNMSDLASDEIIMIPAGTYTVSFACYNTTPYIVDAEGQSKTVTSSSVNYYTATYQACGALQISVFCPATLGYGGSAWGRFSCDGGSTWNIPYNYTTEYVKVLPDSYTIEFENYSLLNTPDDIPGVTVSAYDIEVRSGTYLLNNVYVEPVSGNDSNIGTSGSPVATVTNAAEKVKTSGTVYVTNYCILFLHQLTQEYRGKINENVTLDKHVIIQYTGSSPPLHITGSHTLDPYPSLGGVILD